MKESARNPSIEPSWLTESWIIILHAETLRLFGGRSGIRDHGAITSGLARPRNRFLYSADLTEAPDREIRLSDLAAATGYGLIRNHPFIDGNKRVGALAIRAFLHINQYRFEPAEAELVGMILGVADGTIDEIRLATWIEQVMRPRRPDSNE